ncbi:MAG: 4Fe-4S dicluster domain-containing protein [Deltaproteobacteria bacterium]|nr:4Fe-4S dicluster domain-containing protein [Deltaproteobacteria bacterium]
MEDEARSKGTGTVNMSHMNESQEQFSTKREQEVKGYGIETCFGAGDCPNRACHTEGLPEKMGTVLEGKNLRSFLQEKVKGPLKMHHEFRVSVSDCPNGCSRPQIADFGLLGAERPKVSKEPCSACGACEAICKEEAIVLQGDAVRIDESGCLACGQCIGVCPTGTLVSAEKGYRILLGGKLGRHPKLAEALSSIYTPAQVLETLDRCLDHYRHFSIGGERFGEILERVPYGDQL